MFQEHAERADVESVINLRQMMTALYLRNVNTHTQTDCLCSDSALGRESGPKGRERERESGERGGEQRHI